MKVAALLALALATAALAGCGGGEATATVDPDGTLRLRPDPNGALAYTTPEVSVEAGKVKVEIINPYKKFHDLSIEDPEGKTIWQSFTLYVSSDWKFINFKPGVYTFFCSVAGNRKAGMEGTITVE